MWARLYKHEQAQTQAQGRKRKKRQKGLAQGQELVQGQAEAGAEGVAGAGAEHRFPYVEKKTENRNGQHFVWATGPGGFGGFLHPTPPPAFTFAFGVAPLRALTLLASPQPIFSLRLSHRSVLSPTLKISKLRKSINNNDN